MSIAFPAVRAVAARELRLRWRALVVLGLLVGLAGAAAAGVAAVGRRSATAYDRLIAAAHQEDARILLLDPSLEPRIRALPGVAAVWPASMLVGQRAGPALTYVSVASGPPRPPGLATPVLLHGREPRPQAPDEVTADERYARAYHLRVGDVVALKALTREEVYAFDEGFGEPDGPRLRLRVVGIVRTATTGDGLGPLFAGPAFATAYADLSPGATLLVRLADGAAGLPALEQRLAALSAGAPKGAEEFGPLQATAPPGRDDPRVRAAQHAAVTAMVVFAAVALGAAVLVAWQGFARHFAASAAQQRVEAALGMTPAERVLARTLPSLASAGTAAGLTVAGALVAGVIEPLGRLSGFEPDPGWRPDASVAALGALLAAVLVLGTAGATAWREGRAVGTSKSPGRLRAGVLSRLPSAETFVGAAFALRTAGAGRGRLPVRTTLVAAVLGTGAITAAAVFGASLHRLDDTPVRWGGGMGEVAYADAKDADVARLVADPRVAVVADETSADVRVGSRFVWTYAFRAAKGAPRVTVLQGRTPRSPGEVALGPRVLDRLGLAIGAVLPASDARGGPVPLTIVGTVIYPDQSAALLGDDALVTPDALRRVASAPPTRGAWITARPGALDAVLRAYEGTLELTPRAQPAEVANATGLAGVPDALVAFLAVLTAAVLAHALVLLPRRRAGDLAALRALGVTPRGVVASVLVAAGTVALVGLLTGVPLGLLAGRVLWAETARAIGVATDAAPPVRALALLVPGAFLGALLVAVVPAVGAARARAGVALKDE